MSGSIATWWSQNWKGKKTQDSPHLDRFGLKIHRLLAGFPSNPFRSEVLWLHPTFLVPSRSTPRVKCSRGSRVELQAHCDHQDQLLDQLSVEITLEKTMKYEKLGGFFWPILEVTSGEIGKGHRISRAWGFKTKMPLPGSVMPAPHGQAAVEDSTVVEAPPVDFYELLIQISRLPTVPCLTETPVEQWFKSLLPCSLFVREPPNLTWLGILFFVIWTQTQLTVSITFIEVKRHGALIRTSSVPNPKRSWNYAAWRWGLVSLAPKMATL